MSQVLKVWSKFTVTRKDGTVLNLRTVELPLNTKVSETVLKCFLQYFVLEECNVVAAKIPESAEAMEEMADFLRNESVLRDKEPHVVVCCFDNGDDENIDVLGASVTSLVRKDDPPPKTEYKTKEMNKLMEIFMVTAEIYDEAKVFNLDPCLSDRGLVVCPQYRGLGIAQELLKVRRLMCKEFGIPITGAWMSSYGTQKAAARDGWETVCELQHEDLEKKFNVTFGRDPPSTKFMITRIPI